MASVKILAAVLNLTNREHTMFKNGDADRLFDHKTLIKV